MEQKEQIVLNYALTHDDWYKFQQYSCKKRVFKGSSRWKVELSIFCVIALSVFAVVFGLRWGYELRDAPIIVFIIPFLLGTALETMVFPFIRYRFMKKVAGDMIRALQEHRYCFSPYNMEVTSDLTQGVVKWEAVTSIEEDKTSIYLFLSRLEAYIVPKRLLENSDEFKAQLDAWMIADDTEAESK